MEPIDNNRLEALLKTNIVNRSIQRITNSEWEPAVKKGENFLSQLWRVKIKGILGSGEDFETTVIIKAFTEKPRTKEFVERMGIFDIEYYMYKVVLSEMEELIVRTSDPRGKFWCDLLGYDAEKCLIFSDLKRSGYQCTDRRRGMELKQVLPTLKNLARFHAMGYVLLKSGRISVSDFRPCVFAQNLEFFNNYYKGAFGSLFLAMKTKWGEKWCKVADNLKNAIANSGIRMQELGKFDESRFNVLNHGDCWINNLMFKSQPDSNHIECMFIDFQVPHYNSFAWDLTYLFYTSLMPDLRKQNYDLLLITYRKELLMTFELFKDGPSEVPTIEEMKAEMNRLKLFSLMLNSTHFPVTIAKPEYATEIDDLLKYDNTDTPKIVPAMFVDDVFVAQFQNFLEDYGLTNTN